LAKYQNKMGIKMHDKYITFSKYNLSWLDWGLDPTHSSSSFFSVTGSDQLPDLAARPDYWFRPVTVGFSLCAECSRMLATISELNWWGRERETLVLQMALDEDLVRLPTIVIKPGPTRRVDPVARPVRVCQKTGRCNNPAKPSWPAGWPITLARPGVFFFKCGFSPIPLFFHIFLVDY
jgi:hypothetical protein